MEPVIEELQSVTYLQELKTGEYLVKNGDPAYGIFFINSGRIELIYRTDEGFLITEIKSSGDVIGEDNIDINFYVFDAVALEDSEICFIEKSFYHSSENNESFS